MRQFVGHSLKIIYELRGSFFRRQGYLENVDSVRIPKKPNNILPFSGRLGELRYRTVHVVPRDCTIKDASNHFAERGCEYLVVQDNHIPIGVVHNTDLIRCNMTSDIPLDTPVVELMDSQVISVQKDHSVIDALTFMIKHNIKFLLILDGQEVVGIVGQQDWLAVESRYPTELLRQMGNATTIKELAVLKSKAHETIWGTFKTESDTLALTNIVSVINDTLTKRMLALVIGEMVDDGRGGPPVPFAWIGMGSEGREAQTITTDQDNGLIYEDVSTAQDRVEEWFSVFAEKAVSGLETCGFTRCAGNVMATNPDLRGSTQHWQKLFERIIKTGDDKDLFEASIYFDFRCLFGKMCLVTDLRDYLTAVIGEHSFFIRHLVEATVQGHGPPIGTIRWKIYNLTGIAPPSFDIKSNALVPLDAAIRVLALRDGVQQTQTLVRLQHCLENGRISKRLADDVRKAFDFLLRLRFKLEFSSYYKGAVGDDNHLINIGDLAPVQARYLADALATVRNLQDTVYTQITGKKIHWSTRNSGTP